MRPPRETPSEGRPSTQCLLECREERLSTSRSSSLNWCGRWFCDWTSPPWSTRVERQSRQHRMSMRRWLQRLDGSDGLTTRQARSRSSLSYSLRISMLINPSTQAGLRFLRALKGSGATGPTPSPTVTHKNPKTAMTDLIRIASHATARSNTKRKSGHLFHAAFPPTS